MAVKLNGAQGELHNALVVIDDDNPARTEHRSGFHHGIEVHADINFIGREAGTRASTRHNRLEFASVGNPASHLVQHFFEVIAHGKLVDSRFGNVATEAEQACATVFTV